MTRMRRPAAGAIVIALAVPGGAQALDLLVRDCDAPQANARYLSYPYENATRTFANGDVRILTLQQDEPACCGAYVMVLLPSPEDPGMICAFVTTPDGMGWQGTDLRGTVADYDPSRGLFLRIPAWTYGEVHGSPFSLDLTINQQTGVVTAEEGPP